MKCRTHVKEHLVQTPFLSSRKSDTPPILDTFHFFFIKQTDYNNELSNHAEDFLLLFS